jgi:hypothetical protein
MVSESTIAGFITLAIFVIGRNRLGAVIIILLDTPSQAEPHSSVDEPCDERTSECQQECQHGAERNKMFFFAVGAIRFSRLVFPLESRHSCCFKFGGDCGACCGGLDKGAEARCAGARGCAGGRTS